MLCAHWHYMVVGMMIKFAFREGAGKRGWDCTTGIHLKSVYNISNFCERVVSYLQSSVSLLFNINTLKNSALFFLLFFGPPGNFHSQFWWVDGWMDGWLRGACPASQAYVI